MVNSRLTAHADRCSLPLSLIKKNAPVLSSLSKRAQFANCASMTKSFLTKAFPSHNRKLWGSHTSPTGIDDPTDMSSVSTNQNDEAARGDVCEIIVVAIQRVTSLASDAADDSDHAKTLNSSQMRRSSLWHSAKWSQERLQLPERISCTVRSATTVKVSAQSERNDNKFVFDEKFVFERRENDAQYRDVIIEVSSATSSYGKKYHLGQVAVDLDAVFATHASGPVYQRSPLTRANGSDSDVEVHYMLHRLVVQNAKAAAASCLLTRSSTSLNDDDDMDACGQIFPDLWYLC